MLELKNIKKHYNIGTTTTKALNDVSVSFRRKEFVAILGPSGSGKTTMLNIIGGLDKYDSGDLVIDGKSTKNFKDSEWDAYRNNSIGFVFQSYNLIHHLSILDNVELGMTLSGVSNEEKHEKATQALTRVGLKEHIHKKPNQLSGGQMQRVAIARALANNPDILLCDEPTGALDTETSKQIMDLIQELSREKLVIMVTHNPELAHQYANRIIEFSDGKIITDSNPHVEGQKKDDFQLKYTKMTFFTALKLSFNNIKTKKGRTFLTVFASSIGIIGIAVVLSLSNGFQTQIDNTQSETLANYPITISESVSSQTTPGSGDSPITDDSDNTYPDTSYVKIQESQSDDEEHTNKIDQTYLDYLQDINPELSNHLVFSRATTLNVARTNQNEVESVQLSNVALDQTGVQNIQALMSNSSNATLPTTLDGSDNYLEENYDLLSGSFPKTSEDIILVVDGNNEIPEATLENLGFDLNDSSKISFDDLVGTTFKIITNDNYYTQIPTGNFVPNKLGQTIYDNENNITIQISGILRAKKDSTLAITSAGVAYSDELVQEVIAANQNSAIVEAQTNSETNVMTNEQLTETTKNTLLASLGNTTIPSSIMIYPNNFENKDKLLTYLDDYNDNKSKANQIIYTDLASTVTSLTGGLMDAITYVLVAFAGISLVTSVIMISIITYTSVIERTKEIGVLKALGARKKDITRVFNAETFILGVSSGLLGVLIAWLCTIPINVILENLTGLADVANLNPIHSIWLIAISTLLTMLGGYIPARIAAKKDAAIALRSE